MNNICLISITASHYRTLIYQLLEKEVGCEFVFGLDTSTVKHINQSALKNVKYAQNHYCIKDEIFYQADTLQNTQQYKIIINDLGIKSISSWMLLFSAKWRGQKVYHWDHGWYGREGFMKRWLKRIYFGMADGAFIYGHYARHLMVKHRFESGKLHVIHNSLDYDKQFLLRQTLAPSSIFVDHFGNNLPILCFIGRLTFVKKLDQLIDALHVLNCNGTPVNAVIIGEGEAQNALTSQIKELDLESQIWLYGACYDEKTNAELIYNADLCVAPGNIGLTAMHAMMFGCPCISHNDFPWQMPEFEAIQEGITGAFFERDNVYSLAQTIQVWFTKNVNRRQQIREACFDEIDKNWNPHKQLEIIKRVING